ncbi:acyltransferase 3 [Mariannaea sp. PMI_226]|nr:acyltransferase 3 [Mariannaea sp. PMI_226]
MRSRNRLDQDSGEDAMSPRSREEPARALEAHVSDMPPRYAGRGGDDEKVSTSNSTKSRDKISCLDGLRGIACLIVFNYHFLWPWTPAIMLGYGALPPRSPEPYWGLPSLPIICLLHRGRAMVAIFFAISGYVLCRHILRAIHERRLDTAYRSLASAVFRRVFRLYTPPTISMFLVAILAQVGVFRSEKAIFTGPDSIYINGTVTTAELRVNATCVNGTHAATGIPGVAQFLGLQSPIYVANATFWDNSTWNETLCLNSTSQLFGPPLLYSLEVELESPSNDTTGLNGTIELDAFTTHSSLKGKTKSVKEKARSVKEKSKNDLNITESLNLTWVQLGGNWEEHPFIHDNMTYALKNFTRAYAEWANPFNFGHYHPRYDPHTWTIPMELRGSMVLYIFLLGTAALQAKWRLRIGATLSGYSLILGRWDIATFVGGMVFSELDIRRASDPQQDGATLVPPATSSTRGRYNSAQRPTGKENAAWWILFIISLYFLSYPDAGAEYTPGFVFLSDWVPRYYHPLSGWMYYEAIGALMLLHCILRSPRIRAFLEGRFPQYMGKVSFSFYLIHGPVLHSLGFWIMPRLFDNFGRTVGYVIGYVIQLSVTFYLTNLWYRKVDIWSMTVGRRIESHLKE